MEKIPYTSIVGSLLYAHTCIGLDINFVVGMLSRYQNNLGMDHLKATKKVLRYLQWTKCHMLTCRRSNHVKVIKYSDSNFVECIDTKNSTFSYLFLLVGQAISRKSWSSLSLQHSLWRLSLSHSFRPLFLDYVVELYFKTWNYQ